MIIDAWDLVVALDYGQFVLVGGDAVEPEDVVAAIEIALRDNVGIGQVGDTLGICSPHQNNFQMPLRVELCSSDPGRQLTAWQEVFEASIGVGSDGLRYESPTLEAVTVPVPAGKYAARICGRGFVAKGWPGSATPGDEWLVQLWPSGARGRPVRVSSWDGDDAFDTRSHSSRLGGSSPSVQVPLPGSDAEYWAAAERSLAEDPWHQIYLAVIEFRDIQRAQPCRERWLRRAEIEVVERSFEMRQWSDEPDLLPVDAVNGLRHELALVESDPEARGTAWPDLRDRVLRIGRLALQAIEQVRPDLAAG